MTGSTEGRLDATVAGFSESIAPEPDAVQRDMMDRARESGFPVVGAAAGAWLMVLARVSDADRVLEMGSGYGYSATWFARGMQDDGEILLTEYDADLLEDSEDYLGRGGYPPEFTFMSGDAVETVDELEGSFDVVFIDIDKTAYPEAFDTVRDRVNAGGLVVADNVMWAGNELEGDVVNFPAVAEVYGGERSLEDVSMPDGALAGTRGVLEYLKAVESAKEFTSSLLPMEDGLLVSAKEV